MPRQYRQTARAAAAADTRRRILEALYQALSEAPANDVNLDDIARRAGIVRSTVYTVFGDRAGLFDAFAIDLLRRGGFADLLDASEDPDPIEAVRGSIRGAVRLYSAHHEVLRALHSTARLDPGAFAGAVGRLEAGRQQGMRELAGRLGRDGVLAPGVTVEDATDVLWVLTGFDTFDLLVAGRRREATVAASTLVQLAEAALLDAAGPEV